MAVTYIKHNIASDLSFSGTNVKWTRKLLTTAGTSATETFICLGPAGTVNQCFYVTEPGVPGANGISTGTFTIEHVITTGSSQMNMRTQLHRVNAAGVIQASSGFTSFQGQGSGSLVYTHTNPALGTWSAGDRLLVEYYMTNNSSHGADTNILYTCNTTVAEVATPFTATLSPINVSGGHNTLATTQTSDTDLLLAVSGAQTLAATTQTSSITGPTANVSGNQTLQAAINNVGGAFSPAELAPLTIWFDGDEFTGQAHGTSIPTWGDQKGANDAYQLGVPQQPTVDATGLNGKAVLNFIGQALELPTYCVSSYTAGSVFVVNKLDADPPAVTTQEGPPVADFGTSSLSDHHPYTPDGVIYNGWGTDTRKATVNPATSLATWHILNFNSAAAAWSFYLNGTSQFSTGTNTVSFHTDPNIAYRGTGSAGGATFNGKIAEILIFDAVLSQADREKVEGYLAHRWGLAAVLDSGHPYKSAPPAGTGAGIAIEVDVKVTGAHNTSAVTQSAAADVDLAVTGAQNTSATTQTSSITLDVPRNVTGAQNTLATTQAAAADVDLKVTTGAQNTSAVTQAAAADVDLKVTTGLQGTQAATQSASADVDVKVTGAQNTLATTQAAGADVDLKVTGAQTTNATTQSGTIGAVLPPINASAAQNTLAALTSGTISVAPLAKQIWVKHAGAWKLATVHVKDGGVWKQPTHVFAKDAGTWKEL